MVKGQSLLLCGAYVSLLLGCSDPEGGNDPMGSGGETVDATGTGGMSEIVNEGRAPTPSGPGRSTQSILYCPEVACAERPKGDYRLVERCESSGTWADTSCPDASFGWTLVNASGSVSWGTGFFDWDLQSEIEWSIEYPDSCGGCDALERYQGLQVLSCVNTASTCRCSAKTSISESYDASESISIDGSHITVRHYQPDGSYEIEEFEVGGCADGDEMIVYYRDGQRYYFEKL